MTPELFRASLAIVGLDHETAARVFSETLGRQIKKHTVTDMALGRTPIPKECWMELAWLYDDMNHNQKPFCKDYDENTFWPSALVERNHRAMLALKAIRNEDC